MIRSAKRPIQAILGNADVKDEELMTVFTGVENSRPLTATGNDPNDVPILTRNHFLIGHMGGELATESVDSLAFDPRKGGEGFKLIRQTWKRWMREYITNIIGSRMKWFGREENLKDGW